VKSEVRNICALIGAPGLSHANRGAHSAEGG
jgi:hypothetical protein